ncbi:MAG: lipocalin family protein [Fibrobacter sp.]|nr:lipocalin family protein [Fibrobacter sp.]
MINKILAASILSLSLFIGACGSDEEEESLADKCNDGDEASCLIGTWQMLAIQDAALGYSIVVDFSTGPGTLIINEDGTFKYTYATAASSQWYQTCGGLENTGKWTYDNTSKTFSIKGIVGEPCTEASSAIIKVNATDMTFSKPLFQTGEDIRSASQPIEYFKRFGVL